MKEQKAGCAEKKRRGILPELKEHLQDRQDKALTVEGLKEGKGKKVAVEEEPDSTVHHDSAPRRGVGS